MYAHGHWWEGGRKVSSDYCPYKEGGYIVRYHIRKGEFPYKEGGGRGASSVSVDSSGSLSSKKDPRPHPKRERALLKNSRFQDFKT